MSSVGLITKKLLNPPITVGMAIRIVLLWPEVHNCTHKTQSTGMSPCQARHVTMSSDCDKTLHITPSDQSHHPSYAKKIISAAAARCPLCL